MLSEGQIRIPSGCAISGILNRRGLRFNGEDIIRSIALMHERSNGLGGGFAAYGIYPDYKEHYALHLFYDGNKAMEDAEAFIKEHFTIDEMGEIPVRKHPNIPNPPLIWRYFVKPLREKVELSGFNEDDYTARCVFAINEKINGAYVFSSGKDMGVFKAVGFPEDVGEFYRLEDYKGYLWTAHGRYPTNTPGWWGGAHPFALLDFSIVHNGEISSYDANRRFVEMFGYKCTLLTDTEVITYICDLLLRKHRLPIHELKNILCAPLWSEIDLMEGEERRKFEAYRAVYGSCLINGPFSIILGFKGGMMALNDRIKLRSLVAAEKGDMTYVASEESAIRLVCGNPDRVWWPKGGEPVIAFAENV